MSGKSAVILIDPKFAHNVGAAVRYASCFGADHVFYSGSRVKEEIERRGRAPREERMKGYQDVMLAHDDKPLARLPKFMTTVAVEVRPGSIHLPFFEHPTHAAYVFGPEDGSLGKEVTSLCHQFVIIPSRHCLNLSVAVGLVLYDRWQKRWRSGIEDFLNLSEFEDRGLVSYE